MLKKVIFHVAIILILIGFHGTKIHAMKDDAIRQGAVLEGFTEKEVLKIRGEPIEVERRYGDKLIYKDLIVYLEAGRVTEIHYN